MEKDHDWAAFGAGSHRRPHIQIKAIFALRFRGLEELALIEGAWQRAWL
jgi:hypothetical protein